MRSWTGGHIKNQYRIYCVLLALALVSLSCGISRVAKDLPESNGIFPVEPAAPADEQAIPEQPAVSPAVKTDFPVPQDTVNIQKMGEVTNFQTGLSLDDSMDFYRESFSKMGITEDKTYTVTSESTFSMVFKGDPSGKDIVVQGVKLGSSSTNISIRKE